MAFLMWGTLYILVLARTVGSTVACSDAMGTLYCSGELASSSDMCFLKSFVRCGCQQSCQSRPECGGLDDTDSVCDCIFNAYYCELAGYEWFLISCPTTCVRRTNVTCDPLLVVEGASPLFNNRAPTTLSPLYMDAVTFQCDPGWLQISGPSSRRLKRVCMLDGSWLLHPDYQSPSLVCERVNCGAVPAAPALTSPSQASGVFEDWVIYSCVTGYNNTGPGQGSHTCNATALWERTEPDPVCTPVSCGAPPTVSNASPSLTSGTYNDVVTYTCDDGFNLTSGDQGQRHCSSSGAWVLDPQYPDPVCLGVTCGPPPFVVGATPSSPIGYFPEHVTYTCKAGYALVGGGSGETRCKAEGLWETNTTFDPAPLCLGEFAKFINSENEIDPVYIPPPGTLTSASARSNLHCASLCTTSVHCHGYSFNKDSSVCVMNTGSRLPVVSSMKKLYD